MGIVSSLTIGAGICGGICTGFYAGREMYANRPSYHPTRPFMQRFRFANLNQETRFKQFAALSVGGLLIGPVYFIITALLTLGLGASLFSTPMIFSSSYVAGCAASMISLNL